MRRNRIQSLCWGKGPNITRQRASIKEDRFIHIVRRDGCAAGSHILINFSVRVGVQLTDTSTVGCRVLTAVVRSRPGINAFV